MNNKALHISHTDIRYDPRILKEISSLSEIEFIEIFTIGISNLNKYEKIKQIISQNSLLNCFQENLDFLLKVSFIH